MSAKGYYKKHGKGYVCPVCGTIYPSPWDKKLAMNCCADKKPLSEQAVREAEGVLESYSMSQRELVNRLLGNLKPLNEESETVSYKPKKPIKPRIPKIARQYNKAWNTAEEQIKKLDIYRLESMIYELEAIEYRNQIHRERTPLQRMAFAYYNHNWEALKQAAMDMAEDTANTRLKQFVERTVSTIMSDLDVNPDVREALQL
jgi:hypothetical protein